MCCWSERQRIITFLQFYASVGLRGCAISSSMTGSGLQQNTLTAILYLQNVSTDTGSGLHFVPHYIITHCELGAVERCQVSRERVQTRGCKAVHIQPNLKRLTATHQLRRLIGSGAEGLRCCIRCIGEGLSYELRCGYYNFRGWSLHLCFKKRI